MPSGSKPCFEAHITVAKEHRAITQRIADEIGWTFSEITGCPILGQGTYCYLTGYAPDAKVLYQQMALAAATLLRANVPLLRQKIEQILFDTKTSRDDLPL